MEEIKIAKGIKREDGLTISKAIIKAKNLISKKRYKRALNYLKEVTEEQNLVHADLYYLQGEVYRLLEDHDSAIPFLLKSLKFEIYPLPAIKSLAMSYFEVGKYSKSCLLLEHYAKTAVNPLF